ncbi:unnamed protein product [Cochlearia groenlandica]
MAKLVLIKQSLIILLIIFSSTTLNIQARILHEDGVVANIGNMDSETLLRELGFDLSKFKGHDERRVLVDSDRVSPGGPDSQHHY